MTKFPKALAAAGLTVVLVGCGGGSDSSPAAQTSAGQESAEEPATPPTPLEMELASARGAQSTAQLLVAAVDNYSHGSTITNARGALQSFQEFISAISDPSERMGFVTELTRLSELLDDKEEARNALLTKNGMAQRWMDAFDDWDPSGDMVPGGIDVAVEENGMIMVDDDSGSRTDGPRGWTAREFETDDNELLKVFTTRGGTEIILSTDWGNFWGDGNRNDHYEQDHIFGSGPSRVTYTEEDIAIDISPGGSSKVHQNDVMFRRAGDNEVKLTRTQQGVPSLNLLAGDSTFLGVAGSFSCQGTPTTGHECSLAVDEDGFLVVGQVLTRASINLNNNADSADDVTLVEDPPSGVMVRFVATSAGAALRNLPVTFVRPDMSYMTLGYWMETVGSRYTIETFARARYGPMTGTGLVSDMGQVRGTATYEGNAVGAYVMNKGTMDKMDLYNGEFTADVMLTAHFGRSGEIEGVISDFESVTRETDNLSTWSLTLEAADIEDDGSFSDNTTGGEWEGQFYGNLGMSTPTFADDQPQAVVGEFSGDFGNHNQVVGVFGAEED